MQDCHLFQKMFATRPCPKYIPTVRILGVIQIIRDILGGSHDGEKITIICINKNFIKLVFLYLKSGKRQNQL